MARQDSSQRARLSNEQLKRLTKWDRLLIEDYQGIQNDTNVLFDDADAFEIAITLNAENIAINVVAIELNADNIQINTDNIQINADDIESHVTSNSEHGVTGFNVGTEDFCTELIGGVVLLSDLVNDAVDSTQTITTPDSSASTATVTGTVPDSTATVATADVGAAPVLYSQIYADSQTGLINDVKTQHNILVGDLNTAISALNDVRSEHNQLVLDFNNSIALPNDTKAKHNQLVLDLNLVVTQFNDLIVKVKAAKQMNTV